MATKERIFCYVDGYNLYHSLRKFSKEFDSKLIWCDLFKLANQFIDEEQQTISRVYYCSSPFTKKESNPRVRDSRKAQAIFCKYHFKEYGKGKFRPIFGKFNKYRKEKQTDVNIALHILDDAHNDNYDGSLLFSGDSDFMPLITFIERYNKKFDIIIPPHSSDKAFDKYAPLIKSWNGGHIQHARFTPPQYAPAPEDII